MTARNIGLTAGKIALGLAVSFVIAIILMIPAFVILAFLNGGDAEQLLVSSDELNPINIVFGIVQATAFILGTLLMYKFFEKKAGWPLGWKDPSPARHFVVGSAAGIVLITASFLIIMAQGGVDVAGVNPFGKIAGHFGSCLVLFAFVAVSEELFSRGYVYGLIKHHFSSNWAIAGSSLVFAGLHSMNPGMFEQPFPFINLIVVGVLFALSRELTGGLWAPIGLHFTWNLFQGNVYGFAVSGTKGPSLIELDVQTGLTAGGTFGAEGSYVTTLILMIAVIGIYRLGYKKKK
ncbi:CPBP family intramembrane glutamic endopeptidase [Paenibacillus swuensis]|uniref:CPBP family intramembrane glutamic endopeptidase n=1 Tax=Paenibacillus swuensis TaxID=1178515 RepID=UPI0008390501|nr:CPBP family intramembrane glutamic endopeptidase [Paenibacillus swuensis]